MHNTHLLMLSDSPCFFSPLLCLVDSFCLSSFFFLPPLLLIYAFTERSVSPFFVPTFRYVWPSLTFQSCPPLFFNIECSSFFFFFSLSLCQVFLLSLYLCRPCLCFGFGIWLVPPAGCRYVFTHVDILVVLALHDMK